MNKNSRGTLPPTTSSFVSTKEFIKLTKIPILKYKFKGGRICHSAGWIKKNDINNIDRLKIGEYGINYHIIATEKLLIHNKYYLLCIDVDVKSNVKAKNFAPRINYRNDNYPGKLVKSEYICDFIIELAKQENLPHHLSQSKKGVHIFFLLDKKFEEELIKFDFNIKDNMSVKSRDKYDLKKDKKNGIDIFYNNKKNLHLAGETNWSPFVGADAKGKYVLNPVSTTTFITFLQWVEEMIIFTKNNYLSSYKYKKGEKKLNYNKTITPLIIGLNFEKYANLNKNIKLFREGKIPSGERNAFLIHKNIDIIYYVFKKYDEFLEILKEKYPEEHFNNFKNRPQNSKFIELCNTFSKNNFLLKKNLKEMQKKEQSLYWTKIIKSIMERQIKKYSFKAGKYKHIPGMEGECVIIDNGHVQEVEYDWIRNKVVKEVKKYFPGGGCPGINTKIINILKNGETGKAKNFYREAREESAHIILFNNGYYNFINCEFNLNKIMESTVKFNLDIPPKNSKFPYYKQIIKGLKKLTGTKKMANIFLANLIDPFNSEKIFILIRSKPRLGKSYFLNFIERLFVDKNEKTRETIKYAKTIDLSNLKDGKESYKAGNSLVLIKYDLGDNQKIKNMEILQELISGDSTSSKLLYKDKGQVRPICSFLVGSNEKIWINPKTKKEEHGMKRRTYAVNMKKPMFGSGEFKKMGYYKNKTPINKEIKADVICGILYWLAENNKKILNKNGTIDYQKISEKNINNEFASYYEQGFYVDIFLKNIIKQYHINNSLEKDEKIFDKNDELSIINNDCPAGNNIYRIKHYFMVKNNILAFNKKKLWNAYNIFVDFRHEKLDPKQHVKSKGNFEKIVCNNFGFRDKQDHQIFKEKKRQQIYYKERIGAGSIEWWPLYDKNDD